MRVQWSHDTACLGHKNAFTMLWCEHWHDSYLILTVVYDCQSIAVLTTKLAVQSFVQGQDVFMLLPTGSGKSLC